MKTTVIFIGIFALIFAYPAGAQDVQEIVKKALHASYYQGKDGKAQVDMRIIDRQGRERRRRMTILRRNDSKTAGRQKYYVYFTAPSDVKKMTFMAWKNVDRGDDRWLYLPALDLVKRIAGSDERTSFVGSHFFYEDVSGRNLEEDSHELIGEDDRYYKIKSIPKKPNSVEFASVTIWIDKQNFLPMKAEYTNENGDIYRTYTAQKVEVIDGYPTVILAQMEENLSGGKTVLHYSDIKYDVGLPENIFSERFLRRPPLTQLR